VNDPWLQQEWGLMLVAAGRTQEALAHLEVAGGSCTAAALRYCGTAVPRAQLPRTAALQSAAGWRWRGCFAPSFWALRKGGGGLRLCCMGVWLAAVREGG
jgi:hypothetical protein